MGVVGYIKYLVVFIFSFLLSVLAMHAGDARAGPPNAQDF